MTKDLRSRDDRDEGADDDGTGTGVKGRWTITVDPDGRHILDPQPMFGERRVPVVPCDEAAVARVADELRSMLGDVPLDFRELAEMALRAAGEVPS